MQELLQIFLKNITFLVYSPSAVSVGAFIPYILYKGLLAVPKIYVLLRYFLGGVMAFYEFYAVGL